MATDRTFRLITLGRLALVTPTGAQDDSLARRRRKVALLAVLALSKRPLSRDTLVEMFWGHQDEERARHSLASALSDLRRVLGRETIATRQTEVSVVEGVPLAVDALELAEAVRTGDWKGAVERYAGPFLDGVYVSGSASFEHWVEQKRAGLEALFLQAADKHCLALARARRWEECGALAARWLDRAPLSTDAALYRLNALKAPATRDADQRALDEYERLAARLGREYDRAPDRAGPRRTAPDRAGPRRTAPDRAGPRRTAPDRAGPRRTAPWRLWPGTSPSDSPRATPPVSSAIPPQSSRRPGQLPHRTRRRARCGN